MIGAIRGALHLLTRAHLHDPSVRSRFAGRALFVRAAALASALLGLLVLAGWALGMPALRSVIPGAVEMKANTAVALIGGALALLTTARQPLGARWRVVLAVFTTLLGAATLLEYLTGVDLRIDELLVRDTGAAFNQIKGRMSPFSAVAVVALGLGLWSLGRPRLAGFCRGCAALVTGIGALSVVGYLWNATEIVTDQVAPPVAINTALAFVLLGAGLLTSSLSTLHAALRRPRSRLEALVLGGSVPVVALVIGAGGLTYESGASFARAAERVSHSQTVQSELGRLRTALASAETAQRNLVLTQDLSYQQSADREAAAARQKRGLLRQLIADNPVQIGLLGQVATLMDARLAALARVGDTQQRLGQAAARVMLTDQVRDGTPARIDALIARMEEVEGDLLNLRLTRFENRRITTLISLLVTLLLLSLLFTALFAGIRREMHARGLAEAELQRLNLELEQRIADRTVELTNQQAFLRRVIDLDRNLIFAKDIHGRFVLGNQALGDAFGVSVDELIGKTDQPFSTTDAELEQFQSADRHVIESGEELVIPQEELTDASGKKRWLATVKRPILSPDGSTTIVLGVAVDITDRMAAEAEIRALNADLERRVEARTRDLNESNVLLQQARLDSEAASRAKSAFLANMSHEIRTPMNAVIGLTHLMLRDATEPRLRERLGKVGDAASHLLQVINDILDMSKIEAGKMSLESIEFSLDELLSNAMDMVSAQAGTKGLELIVDADHLPNRLIGDPTRMSQILINLLSNAVKFTERGWVRVRGALLAEQGRRVQIRFEVQDTGPGIALARQGALFSAFEQADGSTSRQHGGTGLGLALSRQLARAMRGDAGVTSAPGSGSVFWFTAWLERGAEAPARVQAVPTVGLRALLVDDLPEARSVIGDRLRALGLHVDAFDSGDAAVRRLVAETAAGRPYDVAVIDWRMAPLDGIETLLQMRQRVGAAVPAAVLVTAFDDASLVTRARAAGFQAVALKPLTASSMQEALESAMVKSRDAQAAPATARDGEAQVRARHADQRVLLAEDNPVNREVAEELMRFAGLIVETANDGARAVEMALARHYDLILMDVQMPLMDGMEAAREIRARSGHRTPIVAMTANAFADDRSATRDAGMNDHLAKPVDPVLLYAALLRWLPIRPAAPSGEPVTNFGGLSPDALTASLAGMAEIDVHEALRHVAGQTTVLARVLGRFVDAYAAGLPALLDAAGSEAECRERWLGVCHSVRGALATIGATAVLAAVTALETALVSDRPVAQIRADAQTLHHDVVRLVARLNDSLAV